MMQTMRSSAKIVFFLVLVAFAGFMILQGLLSIFSDPTQGGKMAPQGVIGIVNGVEIRTDTFESLYRPKAQALYQEDEEPTDQELEQARNEVWSQLTTLASLSLEAEKHGITVTDAEVAEYMKLSPPQDLLTVPEFQTNNQFDISRYQAWLRQMATSNNPEMVYFLRNFEDQIRQQVLLSRLQNLVASMVRVTRTEAEEDFVRKNEKVKVKYIFEPQDDFASDSIQIPEPEIIARYEADKESYRKPEQAVLSYVRFLKTPSESDYDDLKPIADSLYKMAVSGEDFAELAKAHSEDPGSGKNGGDLGWFGKGRMVEPFWEATMALKRIDDISSPVKTQFGWHIIKLTGRRPAEKPPAEARSAADSTEYQASHILIKVEISNATLSQIRDRADNFIQDALSGGFNESAGDFGLEVSKTEPFSKGGFIPGLGPIKELSDFAFESKPGEISDAVSSRSEFLVAKLDEIIPESYTPLDEVKDRITTTLEREKRVEMAYQRASKSSEELKSGKSLDNIAGELGKIVMETDYFSRSDFVKGGVGSDASFIGAAFALSPQGRYSEAVKSNSGAYILEFVDFQKADTVSFAANADSLTQDLRNTRRQEAWNKWVNNLMSNAEIEDYRSFYYGS
jgi:parvulin-like peptidyl-prolyl isomerase